jgi:hypothetical protein
METKTMQRISETKSWFFSFVVLKFELRTLSLPVLYHLRYTSSPFSFRLFFR